LGRSSCPDRLYNFDSGTRNTGDRVHNRLLKWEVILRNIPLEKRSNVIIYGASRYSLSICQELSLRVMGPQSHKEYDEYGITVVNRCLDSDYVLLDPFNLIWQEMGYEKNLNVKDINDISQSKYIKFSGRLGRCATSGLDVVGAISDYYAVPFISHKFEYYFLAPELIGNIFAWKVDSAGILTTCGGGMLPRNTKMSASFYIVFSNLFRNYLVLTGVEFVQSNFVACFEKYFNYLRRVEVSGSAKDKYDKYVSLTPNYFRISLCLLYENLDVKIDKNEILVKCNTLGRSSDQYNFIVASDRIDLISYYSGVRQKKYRENKDIPRELNIGVSIVDLETVKDKDVVRLPLNRRDNNVGNFRYVGDFKLDSHKDDVYLTLSKETLIDIDSFIKKKQDHYFQEKDQMGGGVGLNMAAITDSVILWDAKYDKRDSRAYKDGNRFERNKARKKKDELKSSGESDISIDYMLDRSFDEYVVLDDKMGPRFKQRSHNFINRSY